MKVNPSRPNIEKFDGTHWWKVDEATIKTGLSARSLKYLVERYGVKCFKFRNRLFFEPESLMCEIKNHESRNQKSPSYENKRAFLQSIRQIRYRFPDMEFASWEEWFDLCEKYDNKCLCCGRKAKLTIDHIVPIRKGGNSLIENLQPLCKRCNSKKGASCTNYKKAIEILKM